MNEKLIRELGRGQRAEILTVLKRRGGLSVKELAAHFHLSYMGLKGPCLDLERDGYLDTFRRPVALGRPELVYRLTRRAHELFPGANNQFTGEILEAVQQAYGPAAPTKLLFGLFGQRAKAYRAKIEPIGLFERAECFARLRDADGYLAEFDPGNAVASSETASSAAVNSGDSHRSNGYSGGPASALTTRRDAAPPPTGLRIVEHGSPIEDLLRRYPILERLERELFEQVLNCPVQREEDTRTPGVYHCTFRLGAKAR